VPVVDEGLRAGAKLAQARQILGVTLDEIAEKTRVRRDYLEALEMMNLKLLPGRAYTLAYLKSYAQALNLDPAPLIEQFQNESALAREDVKPQLRNPQSKPSRERPWFWAVVVAVLATTFLGWQAVKGQKQDTRLQTANSATPPAATQPEAAPPQTAGAPAAVAAPVVEITALKAAWLEVRGPDGTIFLSRDLQPGDRYRPDVGAGWTLHARDGGAFEVTVDGVPAGKLGDDGGPVLGRHVDTLAATPTPQSKVSPQG
jgi:cytoskeletal protein RodZ